MDSPEVDATEPKDHRTGLVLFGVLDLVVAVVFLIKALAIALISASGASPVPTAPISSGELAIVALLALAVSAFFMALGIGSILGRRWARSLSVVFSSLWLAFGAVTVAAILLCLPKFIAAAQQKLPPAAYACIALFGIVLPGAYVLFYRSPGVKASCEWLDPQERWTDRCPAPVLAAVMLLVVGADLDLGIGFSTTRQSLYFGYPLGEAARLGFLAAAGIQLGVVWSMVQRRRWAWIAAVAIMAVRGLGNVLIVRGLTIERIERIAAARGKVSSRERAMLEALRSFNLTPAITGWIVAIGLLSLAIAISAGTWYEMEKGPR